MNDASMDNYQLVDVVKTGTKESSKECDFESQNYLLKIQYCSKSKSLDFVKKGIFENKVTGEKFTIYLDNGTKGKITSNTLYMYYQTTPNGEFRAFQYIQAIGSDRGTDWENQVKALKGSPELDSMIDLLLGLIESNL